MDTTYKSILMQASFGYAYHRLICDKNNHPVDYEFVEANPVFESITGLKGEDIVGRTALEVLPGIREGDFDWINFYGDIVLNHSKSEFEQYSDLLDRWYRVEVWAPEALHFVTIFTDITEQRKREENYKIILNSIGDAVLTADTQGKVSYMNPVARKLTAREDTAAYGKPVNEVFHIVRVNKKIETNYSSKAPFKGQKCYQVFSNRTAACPECPVLKCIASGKKYVEEMKVSMANGTVRREEISAYPVNDNKGKVEWVIEQVKDIDSRKKAEAKNNELFREYKETVKHLFEQVFRYKTDSNGNFIATFSEGTTAEKLNITTDAIKGKKISDLYDASMLEKILPYFNRAFEGEEVYYDIQAGKQWFTTLLKPFKWDEKQQVQEIIGYGIEITKRKKTEKELSVNEEKFRILYEKTTDAIFIVNRKTGRYINANKAAENLSGYSVAELKHRRVMDIAPEGAHRRLESAKAAKNSVDFGEVTYERPDGSKRIALLHMVPINKTMAYGIATDITERKHAEERLRTSEEKYRELFHNALVGICLHSADGSIVAANAQAEQIFGISIKELKEKPLKFWRDKLISQDGTSLALSEFPFSVAAKTCKPAEENIVGLKMSAQASIRWFLAGGRPVMNNNGTLEMVIASFIEITQRKRTEQALKESEEKFRSVFQNSLVAIMIADDKGNYLEVNDAATSLTGFTKNELYEMNVADLKTASMPDARKKYEDYQQKGSEIGEFAFYDKQGRLKVVQYYAIRIKEGFNVSILADITAQKNNEKALAEAKARAEESDRLKTAFLANMSHEIRTPMNSILGFTELLKKTNLSEAKQQKFIDTISKSGKRMLNTINDLVDISRIEAGQIDIRFTETNVNEVMREVKTLFEQEAAQKGLQLVYKKSLPATAAIIITDKHKLYHILKNLINNAIKYTDSGYIAFGAKGDNNQIQFYVKDTGIGIAKEKQQTIFQRFVQEDLNISKPYEGSGLGLSIIKAFVEMLNGKIWVKSEKHKGSCFYFTLPWQ